jgi:hypothetical protein
VFELGEDLWVFLIVCFSFTAEKVQVVVVDEEGSRCRKEDGGRRL